MEVKNLFDRRTRIEALLLAIFIIIVMILSGWNKSLYVAGVSIVYFIILLIFSCFQYRNYSVLNKHGDKSILLFILSLYTKLQITCAFMLEHSYPIKDSATKAFSLIFYTFLLIVYLIIVFHKKTHQEIVNTIIYLLPLLLAWL